MFRTATIAILSTFIAAPAFAGSMFTATLEQPRENNDRVVASGAVWLCDGVSCTAELNRKSATVSVCKKVVQELGTVVGFESEANALDEEQLAKCNETLD